MSSKRKSEAEKRRKNAEERRLRKLAELLQNVNCQGNCGDRSTKDIPWSTRQMRRTYVNLGNKLGRDFRRALASGVSRREFFCEQLKNDPEFCEAMKKVIPQQRIRLLRQVRKVRMIPIELPFPLYQDRIFRVFKGFREATPVIKNQCNLSKTPPGQVSRELTFTKSQEFLSRFVNPRNRLKGILVNHSVGTGKTCSAVLTASSEYELAGWTILWVTRTTLKGAMYKNIYEDVCHVGMLRRLQKGKSIPTDPEERKKLLPKNWLPPVSYKTFSNAMKGKINRNGEAVGNDLFKRLVKRNGKKDILRKTLIIFDEAHNIYAGELKPQEEPDSAAITAAIHKSYRVSGPQSCNVMLLTATPIINSAMDLILLLNLLIPDPEQRFPVTFEEFKELYLTPDGKFTPEGVKLFQEKAKGLISILDRTSDPRQFAQIKLKKIIVPLSKLPPKNYEQRLKACEELLEDRIDTCQGIESRTARKKCKDRAREQAKKCKKTIREERKTRKNSVNQYDQLTDKCRIKL